VANYWSSRGIPKKLGGGRHSSQAIDLFVMDRNDIYVAGHENNSDNASQPKVWKNGNLLYSLSLDQGEGEWSGIASGVFVRGNDIYI
jgi:hypothetical protein